MTTHKWRPQLPEPGITTAMVRPENEPRRLWGAYFTHDQMHDYAFAAVEAYKKSLKPVAYRSRWPEVEHARAWEYIDMFVPRPERGRVIEPLYRLDRGDDECA